MNLLLLSTEDRVQWNSFVVENFPPVGAFLQSYEWGNFKQALHGKVLRFALTTSDGADAPWIACFELELHTLPLGLMYGYAPRGPVLQKDVWKDAANVEEIFSCIATHLKSRYSHLIFARFEPSHKEHFAIYDKAPFTHPEQYLQPRFNQLVTIADPEEMLKTFSSDIKHDIRAAERIGVTITATTDPTPEQLAAFEEMKRDTGSRSGKNIFPSDIYFTNFLKNFHAPIDSDKLTPRLCYFIASNKEGRPVAINLNLLFGTTLTYLYGASYSGSISKRAPGYLHWKTMDYAREHGFAYYDLGGVDITLWHGLTYFKQQFGGEMLEYIGTVDAVLRPILYKLYTKAKKFR